MTDEKYGFRPTLERLMDSTASSQPYSHHLNHTLRELLRQKKMGEIKPETLTTEFLFYAAQYVYARRKDPVLDWCKNMLLYIANNCPMDTSRMDQIMDAAKEVENH